MGKERVKTVTKKRVEREREKGDSGKHDKWEAQHNVEDRRQKKGQP